MRTTKVQALTARKSTPLEERGRVDRTFRGLGLFSAISVLLCGAYLLTKAMVDPLEASEMTVLGAGFTISLATFLLTFLLWPRGRSAVAEQEALAESEEQPTARVLTIYGEPLQNPMKAKAALVGGKNLPGPM